MKQKILSSVLFILLIVLAVLAWRSEFSPSGVKLETQIIRPPDEVSSLAQSGEIIWAGGRDGVYRIDRLTGTVLEKLDAGFPLEYVQSVLVDRQGALWIAHIQGLTRYDGRDFHTFNENNGLPDRRATSLLLDQNGRLWVGTWGGAACYDGIGWNSITKGDGLADDMVNVMLQDSHGGMWFGSYIAPRGGLSYYDGQAWHIYTAPEDLPHNGVCDIIQDQEGQIWIATGFLNQGGAVYCDMSTGTPGNWQTIPNDEIVAGQKIRSLFQDQDGAYWLGSEYDGAVRWDGHSQQILTKNEGLNGTEVKDWLQDQDGNMWLGTDQGLTVIRPEGLAHWLEALGANRAQ